MDRMTLHGPVPDAKTAVGLNIRYWRQKRGYALKQVAYEVGCSLQAISQIERGLIDAKTSTLIAIAEALKVSPMEFFRDSMDTARYIPVSSPNILRLLKAAEQLPPSFQLMLINITEQIASETGKKK